MILHATMINHLRLTLRVQCNSGFTSCGPQFPYSISRRETLSLIGRS